MKVKGEAQVGERVESKSCKEDGATAEVRGVGEWSEKSGGEGLKDKVDGYGEVDQLGSCVEGRSEERDEGEVDGRR